MKVRIGLMGFGRIGRNIFRLLAQHEGLEVGAICDVADPQSLAYLLKYDTVVGRFPGPVSLENGTLHAGAKKVRMLNDRDPGQVAWGDLGVDVVIEATARPRSRAEAAKHLERGAKKVILCVPSQDAADVTVVMGVNEADVKPEHQVISHASTTAHCAVPIARILDEAFGLERLFFTAVHAYTSDQHLADMPGDDLRRSRAASENIVPTEGDSPALMGALVPAVRGKVTSLALKVPVLNGSLVDMVSFTKRKVTAEAANEAVRKAVQGRYGHIVEYTADPIVSSDVKQSPYSSVFDALATQTVGEHAVKTISWHDNGWGYAHRAIELVQYLAKQGSLS